MRKKSILLVSMLLFIPALAVAQAPDYSQLDPKPYDPETEPDIDMYIGSWKESMPVHTHGSLVERAILTKGDPASPETKGAVLKYANRFTYATLHTRASTTPTILKNEQEIFYILSGKGSITAGGKTAGLYHGVGILMPADLEFTMANTGDVPLTMYLLSESIPAGFRPNSEMLFVDENKVPFSKGNPHWVGLPKPLFNTKSGLANIGNIITVRFDPMTFFHPHSHTEGQEEVWTTVYGDIHFLLGKQIRRQPPGTAYYIPPNGKTPHSNFNVSDNMTKLFYFSRLREPVLRK